MQVRHERQCLHRWAIDLRWAGGLTGVLQYTQHVLLDQHHWAVHTMLSIILCFETLGGLPKVGYQLCLGGGGVLGPEKGTDCGPTAAELWLSRPKMAKKRGCPPIIFDKRRSVRVFASNILHQITIVCIQICSFLEIAKPGAVLCPCSFAVGTQAQRVSAPPPPRATV